MTLKLEVGMRPSGRLRKVTLKEVKLKQVRKPFINLRWVIFLHTKALLILLVFDFPVLALRGFGFSIFG